MAEQSVQIDWVNDAQISFLPENRARLNVQCQTEFSVTQLPAQLGVSSEASALLRRSRCHDVLAIKAWNFESLSRIPFGSEPEIVRQWDICGNHIRSVSDIRVGGKVSFDKLENDSLEIFSHWKAIKILRLNPTDGNVEWVSFARENAAECLYNEKTPWLSVLIVSEKDAVLEITTGEDLWRRFSEDTEVLGKPEYTVCVKENQIQLRKVMGAWKEDTVWAQRTWRAKWHLAWTAPKAQIPAGNTEGKNVWDMKQIAFKAGTEKSISKGPCIMASGVLNGLKKHVRSVIGTGGNPHIVITNWEPGFCDTASHCGRNNTKKMLHWDITEMLQFWEWANRLLARVDGSLTVLIDPTSPFAELPSLQGLKQPPKTR